MEREIYDHWFHNEVILSVRSVSRTRLQRNASRESRRQGRLRLYNPSQGVLSTRAATAKVSSRWSGDREDMEKPLWSSNAIFGG